MSIAAFQELLSRLSADVVLADPDAPETLAGLRRSLAELVSAAEVLASDPALALARQASRSLAGVQASEADSVRAALTELAEALEQLQALAFGTNLTPPSPALDQASTPPAGGQLAPATAPPEPDVAAYFSTHHLEELERMEELVVGLEHDDDPERLRALKGMLHTLKGDAALVGRADISQRCHELEDLLGTGAPGDAADELLAAIDHFRCQLGGSSVAPAAAAEVAAEPDRGPRDGRPGPPAARTPATIRVDAGRLDLLVERIGELVIAEAMVSQSGEIKGLASPAVDARLAQLDKITRELQRMAMSMRLLPIRGTFQRMARLARDVAQKLAKEIEFVTTGSETELDKSVVDAIADPLVHLVRNAVDHGIESDPSRRESLGKPRQGRIELRAFHRGGSLWIELEDDGRGLDEGSILARARERGLVPEGQRPTQAEIFALIFQPGFSTARAVTEVSGRGIGLDVVQRTIRELRGRIEIRSRPGSGTVFSICLPLTLAIIDGMLVRLGERRYVIPTLSILSMLQLEPARVTSVLGSGRMLRCNDGLVPLHTLRELLGLPTSGTDQPRQALVVEHDGRRAAWSVDEILGQQQIVVKPLTHSLRTRVGLAGGAILPDGCVGLILDVGALLTAGLPDSGNLA